MEGEGLSIARTYLRQLVEQVQTLGVDVESWLLQAGLTPAALDDESRELPFDAFERLVIEGIARTQEPALGLLVGQRLPLQAHGALGYAALSSRSIRQALTLFESFLTPRFSLVDLSVVDVDDEVRVRVAESRSLGDAKRPVFEAVTMGIKNVLDAIHPAPRSVASVSFSFERPRYAKLAETLFGCPVHYRRSWAGLSLRSSVVDAPLRAADVVAFREAVRLCERELALTAGGSLSSRVRRLLLESARGFPSQEVVSRLLHVTTRTLHRRLADEGTSFRDILENVRHRLAIGHMNEAQLDLKEIASALGYRDFANFRRAFKRWEGVPPTAYRRVRSRSAVCPPR